MQLINLVLTLCIEIVRLLQLLQLEKLLQF